MRFGVAAAAVLLSTVAASGAALAQQATPPAAAAIARGDALFKSLNCSICHGVLGTGGTNNASDLTRSRLAQTPDDGRTLHAFLLVGRPELSMPAVPGLTLAQAADLSAKIRSLAAPPPAPAGAGGAAAARTPLPAALAGQDLSIVVGDPKHGKAFFNGPVAKCSSCHAVENGKTSPAANLAHIATKYKAEKELQNTWILPRIASWSPRKDNNVTATAVFADGRKVSGFLTSVSDFKLVIRDAAGAPTTIPRAKGEPKVELVDRLQGHLDLLQTYQDNDIHNITAYLATLK